MPKMKTKVGREKRFRVRGSGSGQALAGVQAPHPDQENDQEQAAASRLDRRALDQCRLGRRDAALRVRNDPCQESNVA